MEFFWIKCFVFVCVFFFFSTQARKTLIKLSPNCYLGENNMKPRDSHDIWILGLFLQKLMN